jgi:hypothetical protein
METFEWSGRDETRKSQRGTAQATLEEIQAQAQKRFDRGWSVLEVWRGDERIAWIGKDHPDAPREIGFARG